MKNEKLFKKDFQRMQEKFPKFPAYYLDKKGKYWFIDGVLDICDKEGDYWGCFDIKLIVPVSYPRCIPIVLETSNKIERIQDRHVNEIGACCLDIDHCLLKMKNRGITLVSFFESKIYSFFANQLYFEREGKFAGEEYDHHFDGIKQFYKEDLKISTIEEAVNILEFILSNKKLGRNDVCFCSERKFKDCHLRDVEFLQSLGKDRLKMDLEGFKNEL